jgi:hypothetical protein
MQYLYSRFVLSRAQIRTSSTCFRDGSIADEATEQSAQQSAKPTSAIHCHYIKVDLSGLGTFNIVHN